jgi:tetratricopeptide (TPR) repeat protein
VNKDIEEQLAELFVVRDRDNMTPTISALQRILELHPDDATVLYEVGGAYDTAGDEATALDYYERAMAKGLLGDMRRRCYLQYGSTLRNLGRLRESSEAFAQGRKEFPDSVALGAFEALTMHARGQLNAALDSLLILLADHVESDDLNRYKPALRGNADYLASLDDAPLGTSETPV